MRNAIDKGIGGRYVGVEEDWPLKSTGLVSLWDMLQKYAHDFVALFDHLNTMGMEVEFAKSSPDKLREEYEKLAKILPAVQDLCDIMQLTVSVEGVKRSVTLVKAVLHNQDGKYDDVEFWASKVKSQVDEVRKRIFDELQSVWMYRVEGKYLRFKDNQFPEMVQDRFPDAIKDMEEAGLCLMFGRGTASVFHLMRVVEAGFRPIKAYHQIVVATPSWGDIVGALKNRIDKLPKHDPEIVRINAVILWIQPMSKVVRNPVSHLEKSYTPEEAMKFFELTESFLQHVCDEFPIQESN